MAPLATFVIMAWVLVSVSGLVFINPPPLSEVAVDYDSNPVYIKESTINIVWTEGKENEGASVVLYQLNKTTGIWIGGFEYLTPIVVGRSNYTWLVGTGKSLSVSNMFFLSIFQEGNFSSSSNSQYFNIEAKRDDKPSSSTTPSPATSSASSATTSAATSSAPTSNSSLTNSPSPTTQTPSSTPTSSQQASPSISLGAKLGIAVSVPIALILAFAIGLYLFRRHRKTRGTNVVAPPVASLYYAHHESPYRHHDYRQPAGTFYGSNLNEAAPKSPVEMAHHKDEWQHRIATQPRQMGRVSVRYEM